MPTCRRINSHHQRTSEVIPATRLDAEGEFGDSQQSANILVDSKLEAASEFDAGSKKEILFKRSPIPLPLSQFDQSNVAFCKPNGLNVTLMVPLRAQRKNTTRTGHRSTREWTK